MTATATIVRTCQVCGSPLEEMRSNAQVCSAACRRERSRIRRLRAGKAEFGYATLDDYLNRRTKRAKPPIRPAEGCSCERPIAVQRRSEPWQCARCHGQVPAPFEVPA